MRLDTPRRGVLRCPQLGCHSLPRSGVSLAAPNRGVIRCPQLGCHSLPPSGVCKTVRNVLLGVGHPQVNENPAPLLLPPPSIVRFSSPWWPGLRQMPVEIGEECLDGILY